MGHQQHDRIPQHRFTFAVAFRFPTKARQEMSKQAVIPFHGERFRFRLGVFLGWHKVFIGLPIVGHDLSNQRTLNRTPQLFPSYDPSGPSDSMEKAFAKSINSNPDPAIVFLCLT